MARNCSERHNASPLLKKEILSRLSHCESELETVRGGLSEAARLDHTLTASAEWLLDNAYLTRTSIAEIRRSLPTKSYSDSFQAVRLSLRLRVGGRPGAVFGQCRGRSQHFAGADRISKMDDAFYRGTVVVSLAASSVSDRVASGSRQRRRLCSANSRGWLFLGESIGGRAPAATRSYLKRSCDLMESEPCRGGALFRDVPGGTASG